jgi:hypothetical protein
MMPAATIVLKNVRGFSHTTSTAPASHSSDLVLTYTFDFLDIAIMANQTGRQDQGTLTS